MSSGQSSIQHKRISVEELEQVIEGLNEIIGA
jgi:hypothetical protein